MKKKVVFLALLVATFLTVCSCKNNSVENVQVGSKLNVNCEIIDEMGNVLKLSELKGKFVFYFSVYDCTVCLSDYLNLIENFEETMEEGDLIIIGNFLSNKDHYIFLQSNKPKFKVYRAKSKLISDGELLGPTPFILRFDDSNTITDFVTCWDGKVDQVKNFIEERL